MDFTPAPDERSLPHVAFSQEELDRIRITQTADAPQAVWEIGFDFAHNHTDIPHQVFTSGVLSSIGKVATSEGEISAKQPLIAGFCDGSKQASAQDTVGSRSAI